MKWKSTPRLFKRIPTLPTLMVKPTIWDKWCDGACAYWEPTQLAEDFCPRVALIVCYSPYQDLPQDSLREKKTISLSVVYIPEHWILLSFSEAAYVVNILALPGLLPSARKEVNLGSRDRVSSTHRVESQLVVFLSGSCSG